MKRLLTTAAFCVAAAAASAQTTLILGEAGPNRGARAEALQSFVDDVEARTDGEVAIDVQWGGALFKANAAAGSIADGVADLGTIVGVYFPQEMVGYGIADLPLRNADAWVGMRATDDLMRNSDAIQASLADQNLVYLGTFTTSAVNIGCKDAAIRSTDDIEGLKVRGVGAYGDTFKDFGANMVPMSIYDAYQGLDTGLLDCSQGYSYAVAALKQQEVITSYTLLDWGQVGALGIFMNKDSYDALSPDVQTALGEAGVAMADKLGELITADNEAAIQTMKDAGVEVIELDAAERDKMVEQGAQYVDAWVEQAGMAGLDGAALLEEYRGLLDKYAQERDDQGYPWTR
ncbi:C4-dicarboxylate TRAP transporter substrate-binding protein [Jannaschia sp. S6380]|uniref:C4-dicarboxylate TRAP transporter substrate-binding protein n=1 Tax=Jannaschia sp. S6380 TaxID=2926408 RepID=UPI001FF5AD44|nr:C4-dicarboxylate TRAP transporter substrate-binding protein [Jannaschia sp. S6380]MCK0168514.1 C4-dicarboxylate TRAP transporter substrate-binding protein [Jannaschia sp. S6380]